MNHANSSSNEDKVAFLLSVYNGAKFLEEQLNAILQQTHRNWQLYIRNDGSKDNSLEIIKEYVKKDARIHLLDEHGVNLGYTKSQAFLMSNVTEPYIVFCDQDDVFLPQKTTLSLQKIKEIETNAKLPALVHTEAIVVDSQLNPIKPTFIGAHGKIKGLNGIIFANCVSGSSMMINDRLKNIVLDSLSTMQFDLLDYHIAILSELIGVRAFIAEPLLKYRQHENNTVGTVGTRKNNESTKYTLSLTNGFNQYPLFKHEYTKLNLATHIKQQLNEYFYLFEGNNRFKKLFIFLKNGYGLTRKKDYLVLLWLLLCNQDLRQLMTVKRAYSE